MKHVKRHLGIAKFKKKYQYGDWGLTPPPSRGGGLGFLDLPLHFQSPVHP